MAERVSRRVLYRWAGWFGVANTAVLAFIGLTFTGGLHAGDSVLTWLYTVTIVAGHHAVLAFLPVLAVLVPLIALAPRRRLIFIVAITLYAAIIAGIVLDGLVWSQSRFHVNLLTAQILGWRSWAFVGVMFLIGLFFQSMLAAWLWQGVNARRPRGGKWVALALVLCLITGQAIYAWADATYYTPVTSLAQQLPVHPGSTARDFFSRSGLVDIQQSRERHLAERIARGSDRRSRTLRYPLEPLQCANENPLNLLILMIDAWRFDMLNPRLTPFLHRWANERAVRFKQHFSGGNSSQKGVFSFFYGLSPGYFESFESLQRPALLIEEAQRQDYELGLFTSGNMHRPVTLDRTAFASVPNLRIVPENPTAPGWERDSAMVADWRRFLDQRDADRPFLGFLLFDVTSKKQPPPDYPAPSSASGDPADGQRLAKYLASVHFADSLVARVIDDLQTRGLADDTVVIVTSDHGEEFEEQGSDYAIHGSAYNRNQLQVPMLVAWPGREPRVTSKRTSHFDVAPTLLERLFGCTNPPSDYSRGEDLFTRSGWDWLIAGSYYNYAILEPDQITITFPNGLYEVRDWDYEVIEDPELRADVLEQVMRENRRFYR